MPAHGVKTSVYQLTGDIGDAADCLRNTASRNGGKN